MKTADFSNIYFIEEDLEIYFIYKGNRYLLSIDFDEKGTLFPTFFHQTCDEINGKDVYQCVHCSPYFRAPKKVKGKGYHYSISPYDPTCMYFNPIAGKVMKRLFRHEKLKAKTSD